MIDISPTGLIDKEMIQAAQARLDDAAAKLASAKAAVKTVEAEVSKTWDESVAQIAAGGDALAGHTAHAEAVQRRDFAVKLVAEFEKNLAGEQEIFRLAKIAAHEPLLKKARELKMSAARAFDQAHAAIREADGLAQQANGLIATAHAAGLRHFFLNEIGRGARSLKDENFFWQTEDEGARAFWGRSITQ